MGGTETVEEMKERNAGLDRREVGDGSDVLGLLDRTGGEQGEAGLAARHDILVVSENGEGVGSEGAGTDMEDSGEKLAGDLVHVGDHQEETLGSGVGGGEHTGLEGTVDGSGGTGLALHLSDAHCLAPEVLFPVGCPFVNVLRHGRRGGDRVNACVLAEKISDVRHSGVTITSNEFLFFCHIV